MVPVIMKTFKETFSSNDVLFDFSRSKRGKILGGGGGGGGGGGVKILYHNILTHPWISTGYHK